MRSVLLPYGVVTVLIAILNIFIYYKQCLCSWNNNSAAIRMILIGDPQIEGDAKLRREPVTGHYDLLFNDYYMRHVYSTSIRWLQPTHEAFMGDLFSSQWILDDEFQRRVERFKWIFPIDTSILRINITGNHDVGYGSELDSNRLSRFADAFGPLNYYFEDRGHRFVILNAMVLDGTWYMVSLIIFNWIMDCDICRMQNKRPWISLMPFLYCNPQIPNHCCYLRISHYINLPMYVNMATHRNCKQMRMFLYPTVYSNSDLT